MKEFEKYWEIIKGKDDFSPEKHYATEAWEAAIEWALDLWWHKSNNPELFRELLEDELELEK